MWGGRHRKNMYATGDRTGQHYLKSDGLTHLIIISNALLVIENRNLHIIDTTERSSKTGLPQRTEYPSV